MMSATTLVLEGKAVRGLGEGRAFTALPWAQREFHEKLGFVPHPGTFNLAVDGRQWPLVKTRLEVAAGVLIEPPEGFCRAKCFEVSINDSLTGVVVLPEVTDYPAGKLEILAPVDIRVSLGVSEGDSVKLRIRT